MISGDMLTIAPVTVQGAHSIETNYDIQLNGKPIPGARHSRRKDAQTELDEMLKIIGYKRRSFQ